ncbi:hypothetical protein GUJ93_ZPchr0004g39498 [Zizania palustris]|uniref:Uncharacterized protein n=1 Tax=Zizania palustris TaxID=103762 RepID=A0A8J5VZ39_ZIZPA|nr:hypothetical protein GUJ93_ZPchr0004g39498 [Zizania palustris]
MPSLWLGRLESRNVELANCPQIPSPARANTLWPVPSTAAARLGTLTSVRPEAAVAHRLLPPPLHRSLTPPASTSVLPSPSSLLLRHCRKAPLSSRRGAAPDPVRRNSPGDLVLSARGKRFRVGVLVRAGARRWMEAGEPVVPLRASGPRRYKALATWRFQPGFVRQQAKTPPAAEPSACSGGGVAVSTAVPKGHGLGASGNGGETRGAGEFANRGDALAAGVRSRGV